MLLTTGFAALVVLYHLGSRSIWIDEGYTISTANQHGAALLRAMAGDGGNMFAFYGWTHLVVSVFGNNLVVLRLTPALSFVATVPFTYFLVRRLLGRPAAIGAAALVAASVPLVYWGQMARAYTPALLLVTAATYFFVVAVQTDRTAAYVAYWLVGALAVNTILLTALCLFAHAVSLPLLEKGRANRRRLAITYAAIAACAVPIAVVAELKGTRPIQWITSPTASDVYYIAHFLTGAEASGRHTATEAPTFVAMLAALAFSLVIAGVTIAAAPLGRVMGSRPAGGPGVRPSPRCHRSDDPRPPAAQRSLPRLHGGGDSDAGRCDAGADTAGSVGSGRHHRALRSACSADRQLRHADRVVEPGHHLRARSVAAF